MKNFVARLDDLQKLPSDTGKENCLEKFNKGGAIWRIFLLHCWSESEYPIYDVHVHRAMTFICGEQREEIGGWDDRRKIDAYLNRYIPFFERFGDHDSRAVDQALVAFGQSLVRRGAWHRAIGENANADQDDGDSNRFWIVFNFF